METEIASAKFFNRKWKIVGVVIGILLLGYLVSGLRSPEYQRVLTTGTASMGMVVDAQFNAKLPPRASGAQAIDVTVEFSDQKGNKRRFVQTVFVNGAAPAKLKGAPVDVHYVLQGSGFKAISNLNRQVIRVGV